MFEGLWAQMGKTKFDSDPQKRQATVLRVVLWTDRWATVA